MDFSKKYLKKYGWEEGEGLGKTKSGIKSAIKPKLKFDKAGMGYDPSVEFTDSWWMTVYNNALENVNVEKEEKEKNKKNTEKDQEERNTEKKKMTEESFIDLFNACEGRTVHKGARQGLTLSGKLQRLQEQEQELQLSPKKEKKRKRKTKESVDDEKTEEENREAKTKKKKKDSTS